MTISNIVATQTIPIPHRKSHKTYFNRPDYIPSLLTRSLLFPFVVEMKRSFSISFIILYYRQFLIIISAQDKLNESMCSAFSFALINLSSLFQLKLTFHQHCFSLVTSLKGHWLWECCEKHNGMLIENERDVHSSIKAWKYLYFAYLLLSFSLRKFFIHKMCIIELWIFIRNC